MNLLKKGKATVNIPGIKTWEEGRKWLKKHGWELRYHSDCQVDKGTVAITIAKKNSCNIEVQTYASTDLEAFQTVIKRAKEIDASKK